MNYTGITSENDEIGQRLDFLISISMGCTHCRRIALSELENGVPVLIIAIDCILNEFSDIYISGAIGRLLALLPLNPIYRLNINENQD